jgi:hypothetical protein
MESVAGGREKRRSKALDIVMLIGASLLVATVLTAAFWLADKHINPAWLFAEGAALIFSPVVDCAYRSKLPDPASVSFFLGGTLGHVLVFLLVLAYLGFLWYLPIVVLELWVGCTITIWRFGPPPDKALR